MNRIKRRNVIPRTAATRSRTRITRRPKGLLDLLDRLGIITPPPRQ